MPTRTIPLGGRRHLMQTSLEVRGRSPRNPVMAWALVLGLGALLPVHAQEPNLPPKKLQGDEVRTTARQQDPRLRARWRAQQISTLKAEAEYQNARLARAIAEIALPEYEER